MTRNVQEFLTFMLLIDLNVDCIDAFLNIIPGKKLLAFGKSLLSLFDQSVSISEGESHEEVEQSLTTFNEPLFIGSP